MAHPTGNAAGFQLLPSALRTSTQGSVRLAGSHARTHAPLCCGLRMLDEASVAKNVEAIAAGKAPAKVPTKIFKALKKSSGTIAAGCEYKRTADHTEALSTEESVDLRQLGLKVRRNKVAVILVDCSTPAGKDDCEIVAKEQQTAKGSFPGPVPIIRSGDVNSVEHVAEAKALGCEGVMLSMREAAAHDLINACNGVANFACIARHVADWLISRARVWLLTSSWGTILAP